MTNTISPVQSSPVQSSPVQSSPDRTGLLAVIVPVYNVEKYLSKCLDSLINQTYRNLQIICVNDGSPDRCGDILEEYAKKDSRIVVIHKENGGVSSARNAALDYISERFIDCHYLYEYITFVDPDDCLDVDALKTCIDRFNDDVDVVCCGLEKIYEDESVAYRHIISSNDAGFDGTYMVSSKTIWHTNHYACGKIYRATIIILNKLRFPIGLVFEDSYFCPVVLFFCRSVFFEKSAPYKYLIRHESTCGQLNSKKPSVARNILLVHEALIGFMLDNNLINKYGAGYSSKFYNDVFTALFYSTGDERNNIQEQALSIIYRLPECFSSPLDRRKMHLIQKLDLSEYKKYYLLGFIKKKHRIDYDKYYILGIPLLRVRYTEEAKYVSIFGLIKFKSK